jgi:hypothetical protein
MKQRSTIAAGVVTAICLGVGFAYVARVHAQTQPSIQTAIQKGAPVETHATGTFEVKLVPQPDNYASATEPTKAADGADAKAVNKSNDKAAASPLGRMTMDKQFHGDLEATSKGQMLTAGTDVKGSAGYVAIERVTGTLNGRAGSFILQHSATLARGVPQQSITVVPDSGTGQLVGISGKMTVIIDAGKHSYVFDYTLPTAP